MIELAAALALAALLGWLGWRRRGAGRRAPGGAASGASAPEGSTAGLLAAISDLEREVRARRETEAELRAARERYRTVSELSSDLSFAFRFGPGGRLGPDWVTQAFQRISGYSLAEVRDAGLHTLVHPSDWPAVAAELRRARDGEPTSFRARIVTKSGEVRWLDTRLARVGSAAGDGLRLVGSSQDVTEAVEAFARGHRLEAHLNEARRLESLALLAGGIAHDFNNALSVVLGNVSLALAELPPESPLRPRLARVRSAARHAVSLTEQMLTYSGDAAATLKPLDLTQLLEEARELLEASVGEHCALHCELAPQLPPVRGDATQLRQVLVNLVANASEAGADRVWLRSGRLRARPEDLEGCFGSAHPEPGDYAFFEVADAGPGMDEATRERVFEPFFSTRSDGRGLGLAAVLGIVRGHGGAIRLESAPGRGSSFRVLLPLAGEERAGPGPQPAPPRAEAPGRVLVIDDDEPVREIAQAFLARSGFASLGAGGGREGLELLRSRGGEIEAVLLDLSMPDLDGCETLREIRRLRPGLPVIVVTGYEEVATRERLAAQPGTSCLRKPYDPEALARALRAALAGAARDGQP